MFCFSVWSPVYKYTIFLLYILWFFSRLISMECISLWQPVTAEMFASKWTFQYVLFLEILSCKFTFSKVGATDACKLFKAPLYGFVILKNSVLLGIFVATQGSQCLSPLWNEYWYQKLMSTRTVCDMLKYTHYWNYSSLKNWTHSTSLHRFIKFKVWKWYWKLAFKVAKSGYLTHKVWLCLGIFS